MIRKRPATADAEEGAVATVCCCCDKPRASLFSGRGRVSCNFRALQPRGLPGAALAPTAAAGVRFRCCPKHSPTPSRPRAPPKQEDAILIQMVEKIGEKKWPLIAAKLPNRTGKGCRWARDAFFRTSAFKPLGGRGQRTGIAPKRA